MSSCSRTRPDGRRTRAAALLLAVGAVLCPGPAAAAAPVPLPVAAVLADSARTTVVVDLSAGTPRGPATVTVTHDGRPVRATLAPVVTDGLAVALVVDTSTAGATALPAWLSAAARFILEAPATTRSAVIADAAPASVTIGGQRGPTGVVRALTSMRARGERDTSAALGLAVRQFPAAEMGRRVVVLYTTAAEAGGETAEALAARFRTSGTILVVVGTAAGHRYWAAAAAGTGGFFAPAGDPVVIPALDQVTTTLRGRHLIRFPTPRPLPATVSVRVDTGDLELAGAAVVEPPAAERSATDRPGTAMVLGLFAAGLAVVVVAAAVWWRRSWQSSAASPDGPEAAQDSPSATPADEHSARKVPAAMRGHEPTTPAGSHPAGRPTATGQGLRSTPAHGTPTAQPPVVARGTARVPGAVARGRAEVPPRCRADERDGR